MKENTALSETSMSRRAVLKGAGVAALGAMGLGLAGCAPQAPADKKDDASLATTGSEMAWDREADAIVIGAGGGCMAAYELASQGKSVLLLDVDSNEPPMSSSAICGGYFTACNTDMVDGTADELVEDLIAEGFGGADEDMCRAYAENSKECFDRFIEWGVRFDGNEQIAGMSKPWAHILHDNRGAEAVIPMEKAAVDAGAELVSKTRALHLIKDGTGRVVGVEADSDGDIVRFGAKDGVIVQTGGFTRNARLAQNFGPKGADSILPQSGMNSMGDGLLMCLEAGADTRYLGADICSNAIAGKEGGTMALTWVYSGAINVNMTGKRFHDESDNYAIISNLVLDQPDYMFFQVYDSAMRKWLEEWTGLPYFGLPTTEPEFVGDTIEELGAQIKAAYPDFDDVTFAKTVADYNGYVAAGNDPEFGRDHIQGDDGDMIPLAEGPFYAIASIGSTTLWNGGVRVDADGHVLSAINDLEPIPGLYAAGEVTGGLSGYGYMSGTNFGRSVILGMVAARALIADAQ